MYEGIKGFYKVINTSKCMNCANRDTVKYKSKYEHRMMCYLDTSESIIKWGYEVLKIAYISPNDGKEHHYEVDFYVEGISIDGGIRKMAIEVKPLKQVLPPSGKSRSNKTRNLENAVYQVNQAKWDYAKRWCSSNGIFFHTITENELYPYTSRQTINRKITK